MHALARREVARLVFQAPSSAATRRFPESVLENAIFVVPPTCRTEVWLQPLVKQGVRRFDQSDRLEAYPPSING